MHHRSISELMSHSVVRARPETPFKEVAELLADNGVSAVPVVDADDRIIGIISEADLLRKAADRPDASGLALMPHPEAWEKAKAAGVKAEDVMSAPAICARSEWTVAEAARLMGLHAVKRLPVVDEADVLVGIVSRSDLLRVFLRRDEAIHEEIDLDVLQRTLKLAPSAVSVTVNNGQVALHGHVESQGLIPIIERLCSTVDGVVSVDIDRLSSGKDDSAGGSG